jgi:hypothetical protein
MKPQAEITEAWTLNDMKALGLIDQGVALEHQTKIRSATTAIQAWETLREFYNRTTMHNRVSMTRRLHEFKMESGATMAKHLDSFDELIVGLQTLEEPLDKARQLVTLLSSLPAEHELISSIVENSKDITLIEVKEKLLKEYERQEKKETTERALKGTSYGGKFKNGKFGKSGRINGRKGNGVKKNGGFRGKCFKCDQVGHMKRDCPNKVDNDNEDAVFAVGDVHSPSWLNSARSADCKEDTVFAVEKDRSPSWLIDSGATSHMTPHRDDLYEYVVVDTNIEVTIADGKKLRVAGTGSVRLKGIDGKRIRMVEVLHIPGLDRRLLSVGELAERGMSVEFQRTSCVIWVKTSAIALGKKVGKAYLLDYHVMG